MGLQDKHGAKGQMYLQRDWEESSSGHLETFDDVELEASPDGKDVFLIRTQGEVNFYKDLGGSPGKTKIRITTRDLISLIEKHGTQA